MDALNKDAWNRSENEANGCAVTSVDGERRIAFKIYDI
jgi:hypothetical protein